jgi:hypothetical protein
MEPEVQARSRRCRDGVEAHPPEDLIGSPQELELRATTDLPCFHSKHFACCSSWRQEGVELADQVIENILLFYNRENLYHQKYQLA